MVPLFHCLLWFLRVNGPIFLLHTQFIKKTNNSGHLVSFFGVFAIVFLYVCFKSSDWNRGCWAYDQAKKQTVQTTRALCFKGVAGVCICMSVRVYVYMCFHTWKPLCWTWRNCSRSACMLLTILLWWPIRETPILLTSLLGGEFSLG